MNSYLHKVIINDYGSLPWVFCTLMAGMYSEPVCSAAVQQKTVELASLAGEERLQ